FFQAEDGIRDFHVTGVQTCALPISAERATAQRHGTFGGSAALCLSAARCRSSATRTQLHVEPGKASRTWPSFVQVPYAATYSRRSEERRVGKECRYRWWPKHEEMKM